MKKFILLVVVSSTFIMCKKSEATLSQFENAMKSADSTATVVTETINSVNNTANDALDSANVKIREFEDTKNDVKQKIESTSKIVDSLSDKISSVKLESKIEKKDSAKKKDEKIVVNVQAPKVIKETKVVYRDKPKNENFELNVPKNKMVKSGFISISVDNSETVKEIVKEDIKRNNGFVKSEEMSYVVETAQKNTSSDRKAYYLQVKVPIQNFDELMSDLNYNLGEAESRNVEVLGDKYVDNTICNISITLTDKSKAEKEPKTFGEKSFAAIDSGWNVITSIFLFILPLWPLFLIAGIGYYFYKKRNKNIPNNDAN
ncbi:hypothetical protein ACM39_04740 [Chryseobacterium sp. FH2]|uniref:DUF4349 domain-containing protein n=1 Tax=Chryseobacterium sp. FH2 TaxID=1674291 RepID=UPI00065AB0A8|nr:DUF4349 domain-containing protein [Chryseobacterium sp. FH2]KMQ69392.1 hypothetical protein ACM39_04740 [Chryseobacterium sp. FH2]